MRKEPIVFIAIVVLAAALRFSGLTRGESDFVPSGEVGAAAYYHFHPDEETLVRAALRLQSLFDPPLTAYGTLPMLVGRGVLEVGGEGRAFVLRALRFFSGVLSLMTVALDFWIGRTHWGLAVAALFTATAPVAVQQAHFYTVDGIFTLLALAVLGVGLWAVAANRRGLLLLAGVLVGVAAATRLIVAAVVHDYVGVEEQT